MDRDHGGVEKKMETASGGEKKKIIKINRTSIRVYYYVPVGGGEEETTRMRNGPAPPGAHTC